MAEKDVLVEAASRSVQAHERLTHLLSTASVQDDVVLECRSVMDQLRSLKSQLEGSSPPPPSSSLPLHHEALSKLKLLTLAHTPATFSEQDKGKMAGLVEELLGGDDQFFSLSPLHERTLAETTSQGFLCLTEVRHFCSRLLRGHVRFLEVLSAPPECFITCAPQWLKFGGMVDPQDMMGKPFADCCLGHAVGSLTKKGRVKDSLVLRGDVNLTQFCDSFRHLSYLESALFGEPLCVWSPSLPSLDRPSGKRAMELLSKGIDARDELFECVLSWKEALVEKGLPTAHVSDVWTAQLGQWLAEDEQRLSQLLSGLNMGSIRACDVLAVCEAGSRLYNLSLPTSDTDYIIVFRSPTISIMSSLDSIKEAHDNRGYQLLQEAGAYEARMVCEMLLKGAVNIVELLFADDLYYSTDVWRELVAQKHLFVSETVVLQYIGYIKVHLKRLSSGKYSGTDRERKIFYSIFHKLLSLDNFIVDQCPVVRCSGADRDFIMRIRHGPLEGDLEPPSLLALAEEKLNVAREKLRERASRMREHGDYNTLQRWLIHSVRGIK